MEFPSVPCDTPIQFYGIMISIEYGIALVDGCTINTLFWKLVIFFKMWIKCSTQTLKGMDHLVHWRTPIASKHLITKRKQF